MLGSFVLIALVSHAVIAAPGAIQSTAAQPPAVSKPATPEKPWPPAGVIRLSKEITAPRLIKESKPQYTADARRAGIQGVVKVEAVIQSDGTVGEVRVSQSLDKKFGLDDQAVAALKDWRFTPGQKDGAVIPVLVEIEMTFTLR
jgi:protein TonB